MHLFRSSSPPELLKNASDSQMRSIVNNTDDLYDENVWYSCIGRGFPLSFVYLVYPITVVDVQ